MQAAHLTEHVHDVARSLHDLLLDFFGIQDFDTHGHIFKALVRASRGDRHVFLDGRATIQCDHDWLLLIRLHVDRCRRGGKAVLDDDDIDVTGRHGDERNALRVRLVCRSVHRHARGRNGTVVGPNLDANGRGLRKCRRHVQREHSNQHATHTRLHASTD